MRIQIIRLNFNSPLHLAGLGQEYIHAQKYLSSDSLYAAIVQAWAKLGCGQALDYLKEHEGLMPFQLSSAFPFLNDEYFFPRIMKPLLPEDNNDSAFSDYRKEIKELEWLNSELFFKWCDSLEGKVLSNPKQLKDNFLFSKKEQEGYKHSIFKKEVQNRVRIKQEQGDSEPFYFERLHFESNAGLFFIYVDAYDNEGYNPWQDFNLAIKYLENQGLGSDKYSGNGQFTAEAAQNKQGEQLKKVLHQRLGKDLANSKFCCNLSMFLPENKAQFEEMLSDEDSGFRFQRRGGWISTEGLLQVRKKSIYLFKEGSVFVRPKAKETSAWGRAVNLWPEKYKTEMPHPIWRSGQAIFLPVKLKCETV